MKIVKETIPVKAKEVIQTFKKIHNLDYRAGVVEKRIEKLKKRGVKTKELENALKVVGKNLKKRKLEKAEKRLLALEKKVGAYSKMVKKS